MTSQNHASPDPSTTFLLVHGAGTSSSMWAPVQRHLALRGFRSYAVDLPRHGLDAQIPLAYQAPQDLDALATEVSTLGPVSVDDNADVVIEAAEGLAALGPVVLVGASLGGVTIGVAMNRASHLFHGVVFVSAWVCASRANPIEWMGEPEFESNLLPRLGGVAIGDPSVIGAGRANYRTADPGHLALLKEATMAEATDAEFRAFLSIMQPDESLSVMAGDSRIDVAAWGTTRRTFVRLTEDRSIPPALQDRMIADADELSPGMPFAVFDIATSHAGFVREGGALVDILLQA
jgi:pimeloyl-ACP methyl ester carboxylesterase